MDGLKKKHLKLVDMHHTPKKCTHTSLAANISLKRVARSDPSSACLEGLRCMLVYSV
jgi:hypothetical protein